MLPLDTPLLQKNKSWKRDMSVKKNMYLRCFRKLAAPGHVDTAGFLCLQQSQLLHPSPSLFLSFMSAA